MAYARYESVAVNTAGDVIPNATIEVREDRAGRPVVPLWANREGTEPLGNPIKSDELGKFGFYVKGGSYYIRVFTGPAQQPFQQYVRRHQAIGTAAERDVEDLATALETGTATFATKPELDVFVPTAVGVGGKVTTGVDAGLYHYDDVGEVWVFDRPLFDSLARMNVTGGTADAIEAEIATGVADSAVVMIWIEAPGDNTGAVTINGKEVLTASGNSLIAGQWNEGRTYWFSDEGTHYQIRTESDVDGIATQVEIWANETLDNKNYAEEWAQSEAPISVEAGGDGVTDRSSKWHADRSESEADRALGYANNWESLEQAVTEATNQVAGVIPSRTRYAVGAGVQIVDLENEELHPNSIAVFIDGVYQFGNTWDLIDGVLTPVGDNWPGDGVVENLEVTVDATSAIAFMVPSNGSVTRQKIGAGAVGADELDPDVFSLIDPEQIATLVSRLGQLESVEARQVPSGFLNARYLQLPGYAIRQIVQEKDVYNAFPGGVVNIDGNIMAIYSSGVGHAQSSRARYVISSDGFRSFNTGTFFENSTAEFNTDFLEGLLAEGESVNFKSVFTVKNIGGTLTPFINSTINLPDPYAFWGQPVLIGGDWYTTGYRVSGGYYRPALFKSTNVMESWAFVSLIASVNTLELSETAIAECANGDWIAVIRAYVTPPSPHDLYIARSTDAGATWSAPVMMPSHIKGTQPHLLKLSNDDLLLFVGKRPGNSGLDAAGNAMDDDDITGIACWKSTDNGASWSPNTVMLAPSWSTDLGQPMALEMSPDKVGVMFYVSPGQTQGGNRGIQPGIYWVEFDPAAI